MSTTLIVPGFQGSPAGHWQRHWLETDPGAVLVEQDDWFNPSLEAWLARLIDHIDRFPDSTIVAHSLGVALIAHAALRHPQLPISRALLVAPADVDTRVTERPQFTSFVPMPAARLPFATTVVASRNDPYIGFEAAANLAIGWGSRFIDLGYAGHVNIESGYGPWPEVQNLLPPASEPDPRPTPARFAQSISY